MSQLRRVKIKVPRDRFEETAHKLEWELLGEGHIRGVFCEQTAKAPGAYAQMGWSEGEVLYDNLDVEFYQRFMETLLRSELQDLGYVVQGEQQGRQRILVARR